MGRGDFWVGIAVIVVNMWILGASLERTFVERVNRIIKALSDRH